MNFKKPKNLVADDARNAAQQAAQHTLAQLTYGGANNSPYGVTNIVAQAIAEGIRAGIESVIKDMYTDVEFEQDLTLRDAP